MANHNVFRFLLVVVFSCSCVLPLSAARQWRKDSGASSDVRKQQSSVQIQAAAEPILDNILEGFRFDDYRRYSRDFVPALQVVGAQTKFFETSREVQSSFGAYQSREFIGSVQKQDMTLVLWKAKFSKNSEDILIKMALVGTASDFSVLGLWLE